MQTKSKKQVIVTIHGIGANASVFGYLAEALQIHWTSSDELQYKSFEYQTGDDQFSTQDFADQLDLFLKSKCQLNEFDQLTIIGHSQGGLVALLWLFKSFKRKSPLLGNVKSLITLATPFWGSKIAELGSSIYQLWDRTGKSFFLPTGKIEMAEMTFLSDTIFFIRQLLISPEHQDFQNFLKNDINFFALGAYAKALMRLREFIGGPSFFESDGAVCIPSSRPDFYYLENSDTDYSPADILKLDQFKKSDYATFGVVQAVHHTFASIEGPIFGIAQIPKACLQNKYTHPTFPLLLPLLNASEKPSTITTQNYRFQSFILDLNLRFIDMADPQNLNELLIEVSFKNLDHSPLSKKEVSLGKLKANFSDHVYHSVLYPNHLRLHFHGQLHCRTDHYFLLMKIKYPKMVERNIEVLLRPSYSTFIDITLRAED